MQSLTTKLKDRAKELGFDLVGVAGAEPSAFAEEYREWISQGMHGEMGYLERNLERRLDSRELMPDARSILVVGMNYYVAERNEDENEDAAVDENLPAESNPIPSTAPKAVFARYARGDDYHEVMTAKLRQLLSYLKEVAGEDAEGKVYVDTGPILEREVARRAGIGWFGKNTMLINSWRGSWFLLGEIVTNVVLEIDNPAVGGCGTCTKCLDACPTGAIIEPFKVDSRRCLSYLTIELKGSIPEEFQAAISADGARVFGCDICQEVCPFNVRRATSTLEPAFQPREITLNSTVSDLLLLTEDEFRAQFKGSPVKRTKRRGLLRNAIAALCGRQDEETLHTLKHALNDPEELVREQAEKAIKKIPMPSR